MSYDYGMCEGAGLIAPLLSQLPTVDEVGADHVDVEALPGLSEGAEPGVCFGYRDPTGAWHFNFNQVRFTLDASTNRYRARVAVAQPSISAFKVMVASTAPVTVSRVVLTALPH